MRSPHATSVADEQAALVRALVAGDPVPPGFDPQRVQAAAKALLRKRCADVAHHWPLLMHTAEVRARFVQWATGRPKQSSHADGLAFARWLDEHGELPALARIELR